MISHLYHLEICLFQYFLTQLFFSCIALGTISNQNSNILLEGTSTIHTFEKLVISTKIKFVNILTPSISTAR